MSKTLGGVCLQEYFIYWEFLQQARVSCNPLEFSKFSSSVSRTSQKSQFSAPLTKLGWMLDHVKDGVIDIAVCQSETK